VAITLDPHNCSVDPAGGTTDADGAFRATVTPQADVVSVAVSAVGAGGSSASATATATRGPNLLWECYDEYGANCFCFTMAIADYGDNDANAIRWGYNPELDFIGGTWWWSVYDVDPVNCLWNGYWMGPFTTTPNANLDGFTFDVRSGGWIYTVTIVVSKSQSGECVWTGTYTRVLEYP
jgi:hypothetical protein